MRTNNNLLAFGLLACLLITTNSLIAGNVTIKGKIEGLSKGRLLLLAQTGEQSRDTIGSTAFDGTNFLLQATVKEPMAATLLVEGYTGGFHVFVEPDAKYDAYLKDGEGSYIRGGQLQDAYLNYAGDVKAKQQHIRTLQQRYDSLKSVMKYRSASSVNDTLKKEQQALQELTNNYHAANDNELSAYDALVMAQSKEMNYTNSQQIYNSLGAKAKKSQSGRILAERIARLGKTAQGKPAPEIVMPTIDGKVFKLSEMKGKLKIVDFWASWCGPCRLNNPLLKRLYETYHAKGLEIVSISLDDKRDRWVDAVQKDGLTWIQACSLKGWKDESVPLFNISTIPAIFILDEGNHIIAKELRGEALEIFIEERLK